MEFKALSSAFGAEVHRVNLRRPLSAAAAKALRQGLDEHQLLVFRDQQGLSKDQQIALIEVFGKAADEHLNGERVGWVTNKAVGKGVAPGETRLYWHSDETFTPWPLPVLSLYGSEIAGKVAPTFFVSGRRAWQALPPDLRVRVSSLKALHMADFSDGGSVYLPLKRRPEGDLDPISYPGTWHPVMLPHPRTGQPVLFVNEQLSVQVGDLPIDESEALLESLYSHLYDPAFVVRHDWCEGDLLLWDNLALQHGRPPFMPEPGEAHATRVLRRVVMSENYSDIMDFAVRLRESLTRKVIVPLN